MKRIEFKAYGGTGSLVGRSFVSLLAMNAANLATTEHKDDKCVVYILDYDDQKNANRFTDGDYLETVISSYEKLYSRGLKFIAPIKLEKSSLQLKTVRSNAYGASAVEYSLEELFCGGANGNQIKELLKSAFTSDPLSAQKTAELERSNANGCYGDLAVNGFISERLIAKKAFQNSGAYKDLQNHADSVVIYAGSTDGGTANTMIDKDIESLINYLKSQNQPTDHSRQFKLYGLRTIPYSKFELQGDDTDVAITRDILRDKFEMSKGVFENIESQNNDVNMPSYYYMDSQRDYWLDGLFVAASSVLDVTATEAMKDGQCHPAHIVEFALAEQAMDAIANRLPTTDGTVPHLYAYNDGADETAGDPITLNGFFDKVMVDYEYRYYKMSGPTAKVPLAKYIRALLLTLVTIKSDMIEDFDQFNSGLRRQYVVDVFHGARGAETVHCPLIANELRNFLEEAKFIVMNLVEIMDCSKFNKNSDTVHFVESAIRYVYDSDFFGRPIIPNGSASVYVAQSGTDYKIELGVKGPSVLSNFHALPFEHGGLGAKKLKKLDIFINSHASTDAECARNVANNMIQRLFEVYIARS